jgi:hypothetical protein
VSAYSAAIFVSGHGGLRAAVYEIVPTRVAAATGDVPGLIVLTTSVIEYDPVWRVAGLVFVHCTATARDR